MERSANPRVPCSPLTGPQCHYRDRLFFCVCFCLKNKGPPSKMTTGCNRSRACCQAQGDMGTSGGKAEVAAGVLPLRKPRKTHSRHRFLTRAWQGAEHSAKSQVSVAPAHHTHPLPSLTPRCTGRMLPAPAPHSLPSAACNPGCFHLPRAGPLPRD